MVLSSCAVRQCLEAGGSFLFWKFLKTCCLEVWQLPCAGSSFLPFNNNRKHIPGEWTESVRRQNSPWILCSHLSWNKKLNGNTFLLHLSQWLILWSLKLNCLVVFGVEIWLNYSETHLHKVYISEHVLEVK